MAELFSEKELAYLAALGLGRLATIGPDGRPHVVPVGYELVGQQIEIGGPNMAASRKYHNIKGDDRVAFVVDDLTPDDEREFRPGVGRGVEVLGRAVLTRADHRAGFFSPEKITIVAERVYSWHIDPQRPSISVLSDRGGRL